MAEIKFCLKAMVAAVFMVLLMQIHVGTLTLEQHTQSWLENSPMAAHLEKVATGAALAIRNATKSLTQMTSQALGTQETQRASRLNLEFQRSPVVSKIKKQAQEQ